jgi:hypothetical protein
MFEAGQSITLVNANEWNKMISIEHFLGIECTERKIAEVATKFTGPENQKSSGKSYGTRHRKNKKPKSKTKSKTKNRLRDRKNIGKRRKPSEKKTDQEV